MHRREVVRYLGAAIALPFLPGGGDAAIELGEQLHVRVRAAEVPFRTLNAAQQRLVTEIAELIIPATDTPGATAVKVPEFIDLILTEWAGDDERARFLTGLAAIDARASAVLAQSASPRSTGRLFIDLSTAEKTALLVALDTARGDAAGAGFAFSRLKALTVYGYFTSAPVQQSVLKTRMFFNGYQGDVPFVPAT